MRSTCTATKRNGEPCTLPSSAHSDLCWAHDPANASARRRGQSRGGKNKPSRELISVKRRLLDLANDVLEGAVEKSTAAVASQVLNVYLRAVSVELKAKEQEEILERLEVLEDIQQASKRNRFGS